MNLLHVLLGYGRKCSFIAFTLLTSVALAQPAQLVCQQMISEALRSTSTACSEISRNEICYGNNLSTAVPVEGVSDLQFEQVGDRVVVSQVSSLQLSPLDEVLRQWGIAVMRIQANLPDTLPGQNVTFLLYGGVTLETPFRTATQTISDTGTSVVTPTQAFYFSTGVGQLKCAEAPANGMIIQTPEGAGFMTFTINGIDITLDSTALIASDGENKLSVAVMDGEGYVEANGRGQTLVAGSETTVTMASAESPETVLSAPVAVRSERMRTASEALAVLPKRVDAPEPATAESLHTAAENDRVNPHPRRETPPQPNAPVSNPPNPPGQDTPPNPPGHDDKDKPNPPGHENNPPGQGNPSNPPGNPNPPGHGDPPNPPGQGNNPPNSNGNGNGNGGGPGNGNGGGGPGNGNGGGNGPGKPKK